MKFCEAVMLAVSEALTNVVPMSIGIPGPMGVEARPDEDGHLLVLICDEGRGMMPRTDSPGLGLGLSLMAQIADEVRAANRHDAPGRIVSLRFSSRRGPPVDLSARHDAVTARHRADTERWLDEGGGFSSDAATQ